VKPGTLRFSTLLRLPVVDADGARMGILDVRSSQPLPPGAPTILGLLCSPDPVVASLGLKRRDAAPTPRRRHTLTRGRFVPWPQIASIDDDAVRLRCRFAELPTIADAPDTGPPTPTDPANT
jgi:hypothetical protein